MKKQATKKTPTLDQVEFEVENTKTVEYQEKSEPNQDIIRVLSEQNQQIIKLLSEQNQTRITKKEYEFDTVPTQKDKDFDKVCRLFLEQIGKLEKHTTNVDKFYRSFETYKSLGYSDQISTLIENIKKRRIKVKNINQNRESKPIESEEESLRKKGQRYESLIKILCNPKQLKQLSNNTIHRWNELLNTVPNVFIKNLKELGVCWIDEKDKDRDYERRQIIDAAEYLSKYHKGNLLEGNYKAVTIGLSFLVVAGLGVYGVMNRIDRSTPTTSTSAKVILKSATQKVVTIKAAAITMYDDYFKGKTIPMEYKLEPKAIKDQAEFYEYYAPAAIAACKGSKLFPEIMLAQMFTETGGGCILLTKYNNPFGHKADKSWKGKKIYLDTKEVVNGQLVQIKDWFRVYPTLEKAMKWHIEVLRKPFYKGIFDAATADEQANFLLLYSTNREKYVATIKNKLAKIKLKY